AELVAAEHLEHQPSEVPEPLLTGAEQGPPFATQQSRVRERPPGWGLRTGGSRVGGSAKAGEPRHARNLAAASVGSTYGVPSDAVTRRRLGLALGGAAAPTEDEQHEQDRAHDCDRNACDPEPEEREHDRDHDQGEHQSDHAGGSFPPDAVENTCRTVRRVAYCDCVADCTILVTPVDAHGHCPPPGTGASTEPRRPPHDDRARPR